MTEAPGFDLDALRAWIGRQEVVEDAMPAFPAAALTATLDKAAPPGPGAALPPLWHWIHFLKLHRWSELAEDGHGKRGDFVPPVPLPRRMFAGARLTFHQPLRIGEPARRVSTIRDLVLKTGRTGRLAFLRIENEFIGPHGLALTEEQDIVYREAPRPGAPEAPPPPEPPRRADWTRCVTADIAILFRYSALIFNAHRIHYDLPYATGHESYPGLVVHGQLVATLLAELVRENLPAARMTSFHFRALRPLFAGEPFTLNGASAGNAVTLWAQDAGGQVAMEAGATLDA
jgi:3-methylfumaryl-CoA hydratase